jgi:hypothetical protein
VLPSWRRALVAQRIEQLPSKQLVAGSNPAERAPSPNPKQIHV